MIIVRTTLHALPQNQREVLQTLASLVGSVEKEPGCISYSAFCDINDRNRFILFGEWESRKDLDHHIQSYRFGVLLGTKTLLSEPPRIQIHTISQTQGMEVIHAARKNKA